MEPSEAAQSEKEYIVQHFGLDPSWLTDGIAEQSLVHMTDMLGRCWC